MRTQLPNRRPSLTVETHWQGHEFTVTIGFDLEGVPREIFADMSKIGSAMQAVLSDACVIISIALQHGIEPAELAKSVGYVPTFGESGPASPVGVLIETLCGVKP